VIFFVYSWNFGWISYQVCRLTTREQFVYGKGGDIFSATWWIKSFNFWAELNFISENDCFISRNVRHTNHRRNTCQSRWRKRREGQIRRICFTRWIAIVVLCYFLPPETSTSRSWFLDFNDAFCQRVLLRIISFSSSWFMFKPLVCAGRKKQNLMLQSLQSKCLTRFVSCNKS
jgi:hypothetical protein